MNDDLRMRPIPWTGRPPTALDYGDVPVAVEDERYEEPLVDLADFGIAGHGYYARKDGFNAPYHRRFRSASPRVRCRRSVAERLAAVNDQLSRYGVELFALNGYRSPALQQELWAFFIERARTVLESPSEAECVAFAGTYCSDPRIFDERNPRTWPTHVTGGALDTTLRTLETRELLHMGGIFDDPAEVSHTAGLEKRLAGLHGDERRLTLSDREALLNRRLLYWAMSDAGFTNYAFEWWHFDRVPAITDPRHAWGGSPDLPTRAWYGPTSPHEPDRHSPHPKHA